ncbi:MAG: hypothetical protein AB1810_13650 [Pseudomonadota bacterium]
MYISLAPFKLKAGVDEQMLLKASDDFEQDFVQKQTGIIKRILLKNVVGSYADLVFFENKEAADRVVQAEQTSPEFFSLMENTDEAGLSFYHIKTYGK